ncbi:MAG: putative acyl-CoA dehydrogenase [Devosia sp.]|nr:putative acyl-CoA dehydrogenase [Devosia sp.]
MPPLVWGASPTDRYSELAAPFRPLFARIRERAVAREAAHILPTEEVGWLKAAGFARLRLPVADGGFGATLPELFELLTELAEAEPNLVNALRSHFGFSEDLVNGEAGPWRAAWVKRLAAGETIGSGSSEAAGNVVGSHSTRLIRRPEGGWLLNGEKYYTSGSLYADWINLNAADEQGKTIGALVPVKAPGVEILDDWDGFGQQLSASGTARFTDVVVADDLIKPDSSRFPYSSGYFQLFHLAAFVGIARAAATDVARLVAERTRVYGRGNAQSVSQDPQILQVVGQVVSAAYAAGAIVGRAAQALERSQLAHASGDTEQRQRANLEADLEVSQSVTVVSNLVLDATTRLFDALGASAAKSGLGLDRYWRNTRTLTSHNPRIYHDRMVGDYAVTGKPPAGMGGVGTARPVGTTPAEVPKRDSF